jgi:hypothetical protein
MMVKYGVTSLTTDRVNAGTRPAVSLHQRNTTEGGIEMTEICMRGTMTVMVPSMTNLTDNALLKEGATQEDSKLFPMI